MPHLFSRFFMRSPPPLVAVIDDEEAIRKALRRLLQSAGLAVETFLGGEEFLASLGGLLMKSPMPCRQIPYSALSQPPIH
jgi:FixJ family two-component response regulator